MNLTTQSVCISLLVAITTAFITALLNNHYWRSQLKDQERSEYRKLYHRRKLEVYEKLVSLIVDMIECLVNMRIKLQNHAEAYKEYDCFTESYLKILRFNLSVAIYFSQDFYDLLNSMGPIKTEIDNAFVNRSDSINGLLDKFSHEKIPSIMNKIRDELGIPTLLHGLEMQELLSIKRCHRKID